MEKTVLNIFSVTDKNVPDAPILRESFNVPMVAGHGVHRNSLVASSREKDSIDLTGKKLASDLCETMGENKMHVRGKTTYSYNSLGPCSKKKTFNGVLSSSEASRVLTTVAKNLHGTGIGAYGKPTRNSVEGKTNSHQHSSCTQFMRKQLRRTKLCPFTFNGECIHRDKCTYAHTVDELRCIPDLRKTKLCENVEKGQVCKKEKCTYAHSYSELKIATGIGTYKTTLCFFWEKGRCMNRNKCRFAHGVDDLLKFSHDREADLNAHMRSSDTDNNTAAFSAPKEVMVSEAVLSYESTDATESDTQKLLQNNSVGVKNFILNANDQVVDKVYDYNDSLNMLKVSNGILSDPNDIGKCSNTALKSFITLLNDGSNGVNNKGNTFTDLPAEKSSLLYQTITEYNVTEPIDWLLDLWSSSEHDSNIQPPKTNNVKMSPQLALNPPCTSPTLPPHSETLSKSNDFSSFFTSNFVKNSSEIQLKKDNVSKTFNTKLSIASPYEPNFSKFLNPKLKRESYSQPCRNPCSLLNLPLHSNKSDTINSPLNKKDKCLDQPWFSDLQCSHVKSQQNPIKSTTKDSSVDISSLLPSVEAFTKLSEINKFIDEMYCKHDNSYYSKTF